MIKGEKVILRPIRSDDVDRWMIWMNDRQITRNLCNRGIYGYTREQEEEFFRAAQEMQDQVIFSIDTIDGIHVGTVGLHRINREWSNAELGILIGDKNRWGQGLCTDALRLMVAFAFGSMNLHRVFLYVNSENVGGIRCYEKAGFSREGVLREHRYHDGKYHDDILMGIVRNS